MLEQPNDFINIMWSYKTKKPISVVDIKGSIVVGVIIGIRATTSNNLHTVTVRLESTGNEIVYSIRA